MDDRRLLADALTAAWLEGLNARPDIAPTDPLTRVRLDDTGRAPVVPLRPNRGDRA